jgi:hypothetical protein
MNSKSAIHLGVIVICGFIIIACADKVPMPTSDSTPPRLTWTIKNQTTNMTTTIRGSGEAHAKARDTLFITLRADDPEGVGYIELGGGYIKFCANSNAQGGYPVQSHPLSADENNQVQTSTFEVMTMQADITCSSSSGTWSSTEVTLNGLATNFFSGEQEDHVKITFTR